MLERWAALTRDRRVLLLAATSWVVAARVAIHAPGGSFGVKRRALDGLARRLPPVRTTAASAYWATTAAARRVPGTVCLAWALALHGLLLQGGIESDLRIGVAMGDGSPIRAHAWVECGGEALSWNEPVGRYSVLARGNLD